MNGSSPGPVIIAVIARRRRLILKSFRDAGAVSPEGAVPTDRVETRPSFMFRLLVSRGVIVQLPDGRVYLDEKAEARSRHRRRTAALAIAAAALAFILFVIWRVR
jgi:hypothetical protein